jgi:hypothetical protein
MDEYEGLQYAPITLHKYLYVNANPVDLMDHSGHDLDYTDCLLDGIIVHNSIGRDFTSGNLGRRLANYYPVSTILNRADERDDFSDDYIEWAGVFMLKPDLVDLDTREIWEIKTTRNVIGAERELLYYLYLLNSFRKIGSKPWTAGQSYTPPSYTRGLLRTVKVYNRGSGIITYDPMIGNEELVYAVGWAVLYKLSMVAMKDVQATVCEAILINSLAPIE